MRRLNGAVLLLITLVLSAPAWATGPDCAALDALYPEPGRAGLPGDNVFRPLPVLAPVRRAAGVAGTLSVSIDVDHVSPKASSKPGYVFVGNYGVTDIPVFRLLRGPATSAELITPGEDHGVPISDACLTGPSWGFAGTQWALVQGDTLDVLLQSKLDYDTTSGIEIPNNGATPCRASNLHTHGLLVSPYHPLRAGTGPYGDFTGDVTQPRGSLDYGAAKDDCGTALGGTVHHGHGVTNLPLHYETYIPGHPHVNSLASGEHPSGLFWYHPHPHGFAKGQVDGGTTGAITVGDLQDYACPTGDGVVGKCSLGDTNVRVMELKDTQIQSYGNGLFSTIARAESGFCSPSGGTRRGECQSTDANTKGKWVFTINGVEYPTMRAPSGRTEIWRIVNAAANMTYNITLLGVGQNGRTTQLPFQLLAKDGVSIHQRHDAALRTELLIMPATRVEIAIPAPPAGGTWILRNTSVETGQNGAGNIWPSIDLGRIIWAKPANVDTASAGQTAVTLIAPMVVAGPATPIPVAASDMSKVPARCRFLAGDTRVIYFVHRFVDVTGIGSSNGAQKQNEVFGLMAGTRHPDGRMDFYGDTEQTLFHTVEAAWASGVNGGDLAFPGYGHNPFGSICTVKGNVEAWELQNWTGEDHNFHIHQSRFSLNPNGVFQFPKYEKIEDKALAATDRTVRQFFDLNTPFYNDTMPVPRGQSFCAEDPQGAGCGGRTDVECSGEPGAAPCANPGKISLIMDFSRAEQVGSFVYHCHILEHEDGGMMANIQVMCPYGDTSCAAQLASASICRPQDSKSRKE